MSEQLPSSGQVPQNTGHIGHTARRRNVPYFELAKDQAGQWHWCLWAGNGKPIALSAKPSGRRNDCSKSVQALIQAVAKLDNPPRVVYSHAGEDMLEQATQAAPEPPPTAPEPPQDATNPSGEPTPETAKAF